MSHIAIIEGISGIERFLNPDAPKGEVTEVKKAKRFRSEKAAEQAATEHIGNHPRVIQRAMKYRVVPAEGL